MKRTTWESKEYILPAERIYGLKFFLKFCYALVLRAIYRIIFLFLKTDYKDYKYELSICAIFKNEARYLKEWIEYHKIVGIEHFYLYNNNSSDNYEEILKPYINEGVVTLIQFPGNQIQMEAYRDCLSNRQNESHWIALIDIDEFIVPKFEDTLREFIKGFKNRPVVKLNWNVFGTSGKINRDQNSLVIEDFTQCWKKIDMVGKVLINSDFKFDPSYKRNIGAFHHSAWGGGGEVWHCLQLTA